MSANDVFAAQFWPWPDPAVKRDAAGRVLMVNAAFLQLYGGLAEDWHGNAVGGWPAPQAGGQPYRFETRVPGQAGMGEQVYDWIEMSMADGTAFTLARNVTPFLTPADPNPGQDMTPPAAEAAPQIPATPPAATPPVTEAAPVMEAAPVQEAHIETPALDIPAAPEAAAPETAAPEIAASEIAAPEGEAVLLYETEAELEPEITPAAEAATEASSEKASAEPELAADPGAEPTPAPASMPPAATDGERDYERRALPIESDSAVLGNNWRDAVIAKAVGADVAAPAAAEEAPATAAEMQTDSDGEGIRILLAEDNAINALLTRTLLEADGHTVETVEDGALAVEAMKTASYDLIFMDMRMPNMDGLEATRKIRVLSNVPQNLPIIALTANAFDDDRNACFDSGMNDFMTKPVSAEELTEMVRNWTSGEKQKLAS
jgi:CheY-like chemotaxis protein